MFVVFGIVPTKGLAIVQVPIAPNRANEFQKIPEGRLLVVSIERYRSSRDTVI